MRRLDISFEQHRMEMMEKLRNMDPDEFVDELNLSTDALINGMIYWVERHIDMTFHDDDEEEDDEVEEAIWDDDLDC